MGIFRKIKRKIKRSIASFNEKKILARNDQFYRFDFLHIGDEVPAFVVENNKKFRVVYPYTPRILRHCFKNLKTPAKIMEAYDSQYFVRKCKGAQRVCGGNQDTWNKVIEDIYIKLEKYSYGKIGIDELNEIDETETEFEK